MDPISIATFDSLREEMTGYDVMSKLGISETDLQYVGANLVGVTAYYRVDYGRPFKGLSQLSYSRDEVLRYIDRRARKERGFTFGFDAANAPAPEPPSPSEPDTLG